MTRAEIRIAAAKKREAKARKALSCADKAERAAVEAAIRKHRPRVWAAEKKCHEATAALTLAELSAHGITPMQTIIECTPALQKRRARFVVTITPHGWAKLIAVGSKGAILKGRVEQLPPWRWTDARVTDETLREAQG